MNRPPLVPVLRLTLYGHLTEDGIYADYTEVDAHPDVFSPDHLDQVNEVVAQLARMLLRKAERGDYIDGTVL